MEKDKLERLEKYFKENENVALSFIFGSSVKGFAGEDSDVDIGVYLRDIKEEDKIWSEICKIMEKEIDLVLLNNVPPTLISNVFKTGIPLVIKDRYLYLDTYLTATLEAEDFYEFVRDYWRIYSRSSSLIPEDKVRLMERIQFLESEFQEIKGFESLTFREYQEDKVKRRNIERWTENIVNATIDIAKIILASEKKEIPKTYEQSLSNFGFFMGFKEEEAKKLSSFARLRNILAHEYLDIIYDRIKDFIREARILFPKILDFLSRYL
ncbi:MAG: HepT-like ribonuclease domain-containing protein [bacterium]